MPWLGPTNRAYTPIAVPQTGAMKWNPGHYTDFNSQLKTGQTLSSSGIQTEVNRINNLDNVLGYMIGPTWGVMQQAKGVYDFSVLQTVTDYLTNRSGNNFNKRKRYWIQVLFGAFNSTHAGTSVTYVPQYVQQSVATYGQAGYRVAGVLTEPSGASGWWGGDGQGTTYGAAYWRQNVMDELIALHKAILNFFGPDDFFEGLYWGENSFYIGNASVNNAGAAGYPGDTGMSNLYHQMFSQLMPVARAQGVNMAFSNTFMGTTQPTYDLTSWMMNNVSPIPVMIAQTDTFGILNNKGSPADPTIAYSWGMREYIGQGTDGADYRQKHVCACEIQAPDIGFYQYMGGYGRQDILNALNTKWKATHAFWTIVPNTVNFKFQGTSLEASNLSFFKLVAPYNWWNGGTYNYTDGTSATDAGLGHWLNDPANAMTIKSYPPDYP